MTKNKAIEILQDEVDQRSNKMPPDVLAALTLSIEALIRVRNDRINPGAYRNVLLPGETKDYCKFCGLAHTGIECPNREGEK